MSLPVLHSIRQKVRGLEAIAAASLLLLVLLVQAQLVSAATLTTASVTLSDPRPNTGSVVYDFLASNVTTTGIQCIQFEFDMSADGTGGIPTGMNIGSATLTGDYIPTPGSWTPDYTDAATGIVSFTGTSQTPALASARNAILNAVTNGSVADNDYYLIFSTYNNTDCATAPVDNATVGFIFTSGQAVSMSVEGALAFTIAGVNGGVGETVNGATTTTGLNTTATTIPFGTVTSSANKIAAQDLTVSTNSGNGYTVYTRYTAQPTSGANTIDDHSGTNGAPSVFSGAGTEAFGYTTEDATLSGTADRFTSSGGNKWAAFTTSNAELVFGAAAVSNETTRVGFQTGVAVTTQAGSYVTSVIYTAVPVY
jgi:hypothetical protein